MIAERPRCLAMVTSGWPLGALPNGIVSYTARLTAAFRDLGIRPVVLTWQLEGDDATTDVIDMPACRRAETDTARTLRHLGRKIHWPGAFSNKECILRDAYATAIARFPIEILQMEEAFGLPVRLIELRKIPIVVRLHGPWFLNGEVSGAPHDNEFERRVAAEREAIARADAITAPSLDVLNRTREYYGLPLKQAMVIPNPIELQEGGEPWSLAGCDRNRIAFVGRFDLHKGADVLIQAFARLAATRSQLELDFIGPDRGIPEPNGGTIMLRDYLERTITDPGIRRRIRVHGAKSPVEIRQFRRGAMLTVVPSRYETFGNTALEAIATGCPVVASDIGGLQEIVRHDETGLLAKSEQPESLAREMERLLDDTELAVRLGRQARQEVATRYLPRTLAEQTLDFYAEVLARWRHDRE